MKINKLAIAVLTLLVSFSLFAQKMGGGGQSQSSAPGASVVAGPRQIWGGRAARTFTCNNEVDDDWIDNQKKNLRAIISDLGGEKAALEEEANEKSLTPVQALEQRINWIKVWTEAAKAK